jgi:hypothetical protein
LPANPGQIGALSATTEDSEYIKRWVLNCEINKESYLAVHFMGGGRPYAVERYIVVGCG